MKKYLLIFIALFLTAAVVTATVLSSSKKETITKKENVKKECGSEKKKGCFLSSLFSCS